jgi:hypothetical protein
MPVEAEEEKKKPAQRQPAAATPVLTAEDRQHISDLQKVQAQLSDTAMQRQAKQAGEKVFTAEFKRGVETVGLLIQKDNPTAKLPEATEDAVKSIVAGAQQEMSRYGISTAMGSVEQKKGIRDQATERAAGIRQDYETKLKGILGPSFEAYVKALNGTAFKENMYANIPEEAREPVRQLNQWRADAMAENIAWRESEIQKIDAGKTQALNVPKAEVELEFLTSKVLDFYSLQGEARTRLEPAIKEVLRETRSTANQAFYGERDRVYDRLSRMASGD